MNQTKTRFLISPVMLIESIILLVWSLCLLLHLASGTEDELSALQNGTRSFIECKTLFTVAWLGAIAVFGAIVVLSRYELCGWVTVNETSIVFKALFRKTIRMKFEDIRYLGIDQSVYNGTRHFWIYFCQERIPAKYLHRIHRLPMSSKHMRIEYNKKTFGLLVDSLPAELSKKLRASFSVIRLYE